MQFINANKLHRKSWGTRSWDRRGAPSQALDAATTGCAILAPRDRWDESL